MKKIFLLFAMLILPALATDIPYGNNGYNSTTCNSGVLQNDSGTVRLRARYEPNQIRLRWYDDTRRINVQDTANTCYYNGTLHIPSTPPTRTGYNFTGWTVVPGIPKEYTELEYIESDQDQYIKTPLYVSAMTEQDNGEFDFALDIQFMDTTDRIVFGYACNSNTYWATQPDAGTYWETHYTQLPRVENAYNVTNRHILSVHTIIDVNAEYKIRNYNKIIINGQIVASGSDKRNTRVPGGYFRTNQEGYKSHSKIYGLTHHKNGVKIFNGIPARRDSDNVVGMFDTVSGTFFTNSGTGNFTAGPVVP